MITECYIITCASKKDALILSNELDKSNITPDVVDNNLLLLSKEWLDVQKIHEPIVKSRIKHITNRLLSKTPTILIRKINL